MVIASAFPIGSITQADIDAIPADIGLRFERAGTLPAARTVPAGRLLAGDGAIEREVTLERDRTAVRETPSAESIAWPIEVVSPPADRPAIDAAIAAVRSQRVWAAPPSAGARVSKSRGAVALASAIQRRPGWPTLSRRIAGDRRSARCGRARRRRIARRALRGGAVADPASAADGRPLLPPPPARDRLSSPAPRRPSDVATPVLLRAIANAIAAVPDLRAAEVMPIADARPAALVASGGAAASPRLETVDQRRSPLAVAGGRWRCWRSRCGCGGRAWPTSRGRSRGGRPCRLSRRRPRRRNGCDRGDRRGAAPRSRAGGRRGGRMGRSPPRPSRRGWRFSFAAAVVGVALASPFARGQSSARSSARTGRAQSVRHRRRAGARHADGDAAGRARVFADAAARAQRIDLARRVSDGAAASALSRSRLRRGRGPSSPPSVAWRRCRAGARSGLAVGVAGDRHRR